jgi:hypothetical protein
MSWLGGRDSNPDNVVQRAVHALTLVRSVRFLRRLIPGRLRLLPSDSLRSRAACLIVAHPGGRPGRRNEFTSCGCTLELYFQTRVTALLACCGSFKLLSRFFAGRDLLYQASVLEPCRTQDWDVGVRVLPHRKEFVIGLPRLDLITTQTVRPRLLQVRQWIQRRGWRNTPGGRESVGTPQLLSIHRPRADRSTRVGTPDETTHPERDLPR